MNWLIRTSQSHGVTHIIESVCNNTMDINAAVNQVSVIGPVACDEINARAMADIANQAKMRKLALAAGCDNFLQQQNQQNNPIQMMQNINPMMGGQDKPLEMPSVEIN